MGQNVSKPEAIDETKSQGKITTFMNDSKINGLHQTLSGDIGIAHSFIINNNLYLKKNKVFFQTRLYN